MLNSLNVFEFRIIYSVIPGRGLLPAIPESIATGLGVWIPGSPPSGGAPE